MSDGHHLDEIESETEEIDAIPVLACEESLPAHEDAPHAPAASAAPAAPSAPAATLPVPAAALPVPSATLPVPVAAETSQPASLPSGRRLPALTGLRSAPVQAAAVAAGSFVAGAAMVGLARRKRSGGGGRRSQRRGRSARERAIGGSAAGELLQIVGSRSLLVDVHLLGPASRRR